MWWSFLTMLVMVWFNNRLKYRLVSKQYKYSKQWSFSAHTLRIRKPKNTPVPMIDKKKTPGHHKEYYIPRGGTFWAVGPTYININIHRSKRTMPPRAASPLARRAGSSWWRLVWSGAQRKSPRSGAAQMEKRFMLDEVCFAWLAGRRESSFEDGRCKVPSVGAVKSTEWAWCLLEAAWYIPLADPEVRFGRG